MIYSMYEVDFDHASGCYVLQDKDGENNTLVAGTDKKEAEEMLQDLKDGIL